jgi:Kef-type K+ transport system membrane component KefB
MSSARLYRVASVVLLLFAAGHSFGFRKVDPRWNADATVAAMKTTFAACFVGLTAVTYVYIFPLLLAASQNEKAI